MPVSVLLLGVSALKRDILNRDFSAAGFRVLSANSAQEALEILAQNSVQILLSTYVLPDFSMPELLLHLEELMPQLRIMLLADPETPELALWLRSRGVSLFSPHSYDLRKLRQRLNEQVQQPANRTFRFSKINLFDLIQLLALSLRNVHLYIAEPQTAHEGLVYFSKGNIRHALFAELNGEDAFHSVMSMQEGYFAEAELVQPSYYTIETQMNRLMTTSAIRMAQAEANQHKKMEQCFSGELKDLRLLDVLQVLSASQQSQEIQVLDLFRGDSGRIYMYQGEIQDASFHNLIGLKALKQMMGICSGQFSLTEYTPPQQITMEGPFTQLMFHLVQFQDEQLNLSKSPIPPKVLQTSTLPV